MTNVWDVVDITYNPNDPDGNGPSLTFVFPMIRFDPVGPALTIKASPLVVPNTVIMAAKAIAQANGLGGIIPLAKLAEIAKPTPKRKR